MDLQRELLDDINNVVDDAEQEDHGSAVYQISSYGADYDVNGLVRRIENGSLFVPDFQRQYVWSQKQASRFIESLLLGLPVPGIFIYKEKETEKHQIIDGQQRVESLRRFFSGFFSPKNSPEVKSFRLLDVDEKWNNQTIAELSRPDKTKLEDAIVHTTVFQQENPDDNKSIYEVFERLNTGGSKLSSQEIRHCVNHGEFTEFLKELNQVEAWRAVYRQKPSVRMKDQEMILRFLALYEGWESYTRPMRDFLNSFMHKHRNISDAKAEQFRNLFTDTIQFCFENLGEAAFRPTRPLNVAVFDSVMVGIAKGMVANGKDRTAECRRIYDELLENKDYKSAYIGPTADEPNVKSRIGLAIEKFGT